MLWIGAVIAYIGPGVAATTGKPETVRNVWTGMEIIGCYVLVPIGLGSWATGLMMALGSRWGLLRHYWAVVSFVLTTIATVILIAHMPMCR
jgi:hypothetical protein